MILRTIVTLQMLGQQVGTRLRREDGASAVEYGIMVAAIAAVIITAVVTMGDRLTQTFEDVNGRLDQLPGGAPAGGAGG